MIGNRLISSIQLIIINISGLNVMVAHRNCITDGNQNEVINVLHTKNTHILLDIERHVQFMFSVIFAVVRLNMERLNLVHHKTKRLMFTFVR